MVKILIFSQNLRLKALEKLDINRDDSVIFVTPHMLLKNEKDYLEKLFSKCIYYKYADFLNDEEMERCDKNAYDERNTLQEYYAEIKRIKNKMICEKVIKKFPNFDGRVLSNDLGIDENIWIEYGFKKEKLEYYYESSKDSFKTKIKNNLKRIKLVNHLYRLFFVKIFKHNKQNIMNEIYVSYENNMKYIFLGNMNRIAYRTNLRWERDNELIKKINCGIFETEKCQYLTTLHESDKCMVPDKKEYDVRYIQDGYLPTNYTSKYLLYKPDNVTYYSWDKLGEEIFKKNNLTVSIMPFRKKLYLPPAVFKKKVEKILVVTSGPGDWTALKNRSDEDLLIETFVKVAEKCPNICITYRCHPTWIHPEHNGVNSIKRVAEYFQYAKIKNIRLSANIPQEDLNNFVLSFERNSLQDDIKETDLVFGEHSISMIDAALCSIPFASVNMTNRRNFFEGITELGFPHCQSVEEIVAVIMNYEKEEFQKKYSYAVEKYNLMTESE